MICISKLRSWKVRENFNWTISTLFSIVPHTKYNHRNHKKDLLKEYKKHLEEFYQPFEWTY